MGLPMGVRERIFIWLDYYAAMENIIGFLEIISSKPNFGFVPD